MFLQIDHHIAQQRRIIFDSKTSHGATAGDIKEQEAKLDYYSKVREDLEAGRDVGYFFQHFHTASAILEHVGRPPTAPPENSACARPPDDLGPGRTFVEEDRVVSRPDPGQDGGGRSQAGEA